VAFDALTLAGNVPHHRLKSSALRRIASASRKPIALAPLTAQAALPSLRALVCLSAPAAKSETGSGRARPRGPCRPIAYGVGAGTVGAE
jgi:hypothetical protein